MVPKVVGYPGEHTDLRHRITDNISIDMTDVEALIIDVQTRVVERMEDDRTSQGAFVRFGRAVCRIISRIDEDGHGKRSEIEEIYLLRRPHFMPPMPDIWPRSATARPDDPALPTTADPWTWW